MSRREYGQPCSLACALDRIGERWSMLIVRELSLGPLRFADLARSAGSVPQESLTRRLREFEEHGIVRRSELAPPVSSAVYELTELGRGLERPMIELGRWGMAFQKVPDVVDLAPTSVPNALRVILQPPAGASLTVQLHSEGHSFQLRVEDGAIAAERGETADPDLTVSGSPRDMLAALIVGGAGEGGEVEVEGDPQALEALRAMVVIPNRLREEVLAEVGAAQAV